MEICYNRLGKLISEVKVAQSCPTLCDPMDYTIHSILQVSILEWVAFPFSRGSSQPRDQTQVSRIAGGFFTSWATREARETNKVHLKKWKETGQINFAGLFYLPQHLQNIINMLSREKAPMRYLCSLN